MQNTPYTYPTNQQSSGLGCQAMLAIGLMLLILAAIAGSTQFRPFFIYHTYQQGQCTILSGRVTSYSSKSHHYYKPSFEYTVQTTDGQQALSSGYDAPDQRTFSSSDAHQVIYNYTVGTTYSCWYNPADPHHAVLVLRDYPITSLLGAFAGTTSIFFIGLALFTWLLYAGIYLPVLLMRRGALTQGQVTAQVKKRRKNRHITVSRIAFQPQGYPPREFETAGAYPVGSWQLVCYDPYNPTNVKFGERPSGCGPVFLMLLSVVVVVAALFILANIWNQA